MSFYSRFVYIQINILTFGKIFQSPLVRINHLSQAPNHVRITHGKQIGRNVIYHARFPEQCLGYDYTKLHFEKQRLWQSRALSLIRLVGSQLPHQGSNPGSQQWNLRVLISEPPEFARATYFNFNLWAMIDSYKISFFSSFHPINNLSLIKMRLFLEPSDKLQKFCRRSIKRLL